MSNDALEIAANLAMEFEGIHDIREDGLVYPYLDPVGFATQGWGHLLSREVNPDLSRWPPITLDQAHDYLLADMGIAAAAVDRLITAELSDEQCAALIDFAFNCGSGNLQVSTLRRVINRGEYDAAPAQLRRWVYARGVRLNGLVRRREAEAQLWIGGME